MKRAFGWYALVLAVMVVSCSASIAFARGGERGGIAKLAATSFGLVWGGERAEKPPGDDGGAKPAGLVWGGERAEKPPGDDGGAKPAGLIWGGGGNLAPPSPQGPPKPSNLVRGGAWDGPGRPVVDASGYLAGPALWALIAALWLGHR
ncbi:MAG: hypothetical protein A2W00_09985 [Candidatus Eisenbacteria bacterium RBG_16_71_46]|nr:MAG: hypothetical protein A2W00_09985 [Candidatus Eisenbacteria bacterium RBG_16_71_46]